MTQHNLQNIISMRIAVYQSGIKVGHWADINQLGASGMMNYIFPKSGQVAYYNLILEQVRKEHSMIKGGAYSLFKMPVQTEKEIVDYLKVANINLSTLIDDSDAYLQQMDTIVTNHSLSIVNIGQFNTDNIDSLLRLCASHYRFAFQNNVTSYPFFD